MHMRKQIGTKYFPQEHGVRANEEEKRNGVERKKRKKRAEHSIFRTVIEHFGNGYGQREEKIIS